MQNLLVGTAVAYVLCSAVAATAQEHARQIGSIKCNNGSVERNQGFNLHLSGCSSPGLEMTAVMLDLDSGWYVHSDNPSCGDRYGPDAVKPLARAIAAYYSKGGSEAAGEYSFENVFQKVDALMSKEGGDIAAAWLRLHNIQDRSRCQLIQVHVPAAPDQIRLVGGYMHESGDVQGSKNACFQTPIAQGMPQQTSGRCSVGWSAIEYLEIQGLPDGKGSVVVAMAKNWSADRRRSPALHVWYTHAPSSAITWGVTPGTMGPGGTFTGPPAGFGAPPKIAQLITPEADQPKIADLLIPEADQPRSRPAARPEPSPVRATAPPDSALIQVHNKCNAVVTMALTYQTLRGEWKTAHWWTLQPDAKPAHLSTEGSVVRTNNPNVYVYAISSSDSKWAGDETNPNDRTFVVGEESLRFKVANVTASNGNYLVTLVCD